MSDQEEDKKNLNEESSQSESDNQSEIDKNNQSEGVKTQNNEKNLETNLNKDQNNNEPEVFDTPDEKKEENLGTGHQVIHKKDGRLHIYVRQDKYKGELKSKNWVGRLYIDGKQKISSSGTTNLDEAIPILEKWFDDVHAESEKLKKIAEEQIQTQETSSEQNDLTKVVPNETSSVTAVTSEQVTQNIGNSNEQIDNNNVSLKDGIVENTEEDTNVQEKNKVSNIFVKLKNLKFKKPSLKGIKLPKSPDKKKPNPIR